MARETKVGLLAGLAFIVCFAVILTNQGQRSQFRSSPQAVEAARRATEAQRRPRPAATRRRLRPTENDLPRQRVRRDLSGRLDSTRGGDVVDGDAILEDWGLRSARKHGVLEGVEMPRRVVTGRPMTRRDREPYDRGRSFRRDEGEPLPPAPTSFSSSQVLSAGSPQDTPRRVAGPSGAGVHSIGGTRPSRSAAPGDHSYGGRGPVRTAGRTLGPPHRRSASSGVPVRVMFSKYTVAPGDTLSRIAAKHYGRASHTNIDAIAKANRLTITDPDVLRAGAEIILPALDRSVSPRRSASVSRKKDSGRKGAFTWYQIRPNDRYISIAREQLGDASRWREIHELNRDKFPDPGKIRTGVRIKLPVDRSASAGGRR